MTRYFLITASLDHIRMGVAGRFIRQRHSKRVETLKPGDKLVLYAAKRTYEDKKGTFQRVVASAAVLDGEVEVFEEGCEESYTVWKRPAEFEELDIPIRPLLSNLSFVSNPSKWGLYFLSGWREINEKDFCVLTGKQQA
jgi:hypothetical protein